MHDFLDQLGIRSDNSGAFAGGWIDEPGGDWLESRSPATGELIARVKQADEADYERIVGSAHEGFTAWRTVPAPARGEVVRQIGNRLREHKQALGALVSLEMGKIRAEGEGEVQEMIDICDFAVGLSRQLYGQTMHSERPGHRMYEQWHPLGVVGIISAFNFPVAVWAWNSAIAGVCGDSMVWKPSSKTPLTAVAIQNIIADVMTDAGHPAVMNMVIGRGATIGDRLLADRRIPLVSATGSCRVGRRVAEVVGKRFGRCILELGGNNAVAVMDDADLQMAMRAVLFGAVGTAGQRCTSTRRVLLQRGIAGEFTDRLLKGYAQVRIGDPLESGTLMGPLVDQGAVDDMMKALDAVREQGGEILCGGGRHTPADANLAGGFYVEPTIVKARADMPIVAEETFAPILYLIEVEDVDDAIAVNNGVDQGLSSAIFTTNLLTAETFLSAAGSDCGIANVNIGTSGAEIGGAFGGEKDTGGGREAGSDSWKAYMRRQTNTLNWSRELPLAQGIEFG